MALPAPFCVRPAHLWGAPVRACAGGASPSRIPVMIGPASIVFGTPLASQYQQFSGTKAIIFWHANYAATLWEILSCPCDTASDDCSQGCQTI